MRAEAGDDTVRGAQVLHLQPPALTFLVLAGDVLGDDAVEPGTLERVEPLPRLVRVAGQRREVHVRVVGAEHGLERGPALTERDAPQVLLPVSEQIERDEGRRSLLGQHRDPAGRGMDAQRQQVEVQARRCLDHDLAVDHRAVGQCGQQRLDQIGEVAGERLLVAAAELDVLAVTEHDAAEAVPLRLVRPLVADRHLARQLGEHR